MKRLSIFSFLCISLAFSLSSVAQSGLNGRVIDGAGLGVEGARVSAAGVTRTTGEDGSFMLPVVGVDVLTVSYRGITERISVDNPDEYLEIRFEGSAGYRESVTVTAIRASDQAPVASSEMSREEILENDRGQDIPLLLERLPSVVSWADAGSGGSGYSYFSIRGIGTTRINVTLDGVPLNDPAENAIYFANFADLASNTSSLQMQRGVGTSTLGSPSFGGSVNFLSLTPADDSRIDGYVGLGSFDHRRARVAWHTGSFLDDWRGYSSISLNESDGYRDNSGVEQVAFWGGLDGTVGETLVRVFGFSGNEKSELSYLAVEDDILEGNRRFNPLGADDRDDFGQDLLKVELIRPLSETRTVSATAYYNGADGWFDVAVPDSVLRFSIDGHQIGLIGVYNEIRGATNVDVGFHLTDFTRDHQLHIEGARQYLNTAEKNEANAFVKLSRKVGDWTLFGDGQVRWASFTYIGDLDLGSVDWTFFNPKVGARYQLTPAVSAYGSIGRSEREPARSDMLFGEDNASIRYDLRAVRPESVVDVELGVDHVTAALRLAANVYAMEFRDEIALTGELSEIGLPTRRNVDRSSRRGLELEVDWMLSDRWSVSGASSFSRNRIREWEQFYDVYDENFGFVETVPIVHRDVEPLLTPETILNGAVEWRPYDGLRTELLARWVSESQLDNTGNPDLVTPAYFIADLQGDVALDRWLGDGMRLRWSVRNLLDEERFKPSGYSYPFLIEDSGGSRSIDGIAFYYPLSGRSFSLTLDWRL